jgi:hypothetical protein
MKKKQYKPDRYHQTNPPCELKSVVLGRQGSKKKQADKQMEPKHWNNFDNEELVVLINHHRKRRDSLLRLANTMEGRGLKHRIPALRCIASRHNRRVIKLQQPTKLK